MYRGRDVAVKLVFSEALASTDKGPSELRTEFDRGGHAATSVPYQPRGLFGTFGDPKVRRPRLGRSFSEMACSKRLKLPHYFVDDRLATWLTAWLLD